MSDATGLSNACDASSVHATQLRLARNEAGEVIASASIDIQACAPAVSDKLVGAYHCPHWDESGAADVVFRAQGFGEPVGVSGEQVLSIFHDGHRRFEVFGFVPDLADMGEATLASLFEEFFARGVVWAGCACVGCGLLLVSK